MSQSPHVAVETVDGVGRVVMNRTDRHNAMDPEMAESIADGLESLAGDDDVRCIVLTGAGHVFNTGADLSTLDGDETDANEIDDIAGPLHESVRTMATAPKPVVTGINGIVAGGGLGLALASDVALMSESARIEYAYPKIGLSGDGGITWLLPRLVGLRRAQSFTLLGEAFEPTEAVEYGLVTETAPADAFDERLAEIAEKLASGPTRAYGTIRQLLFAGADRSLDAHLVDERDRLTDLTGTTDYASGVGTFFEDGEPEFVGR
ncbi:enoyl-CoA hydratase/isomerase family protein [Halovivax gelatinilyticus]|uniref:enoyl-CoA hydratase/isomerase family protein n=1 Tax=Halovivax gelatinilyticus TaxID=2961597 RepID=UPI0020CA4E8C|nr:enoyl-CoA hydratase-related protein [Halovivax gelatinilyticus]